MTSMGRIRDTDGEEDDTERQQSRSVSDAALCRLPRWAGSYQYNGGRANWLGEDSPCSASQSSQRDLFTGWPICWSCAPQRCLSLALSMINSLVVRGSLCCPGGAANKGVPVGEPAACIPSAKTLYQFGLCSASTYSPGGEAAGQTMLLVRTRPATVSRL